MCIGKGMIAVKNMNEPLYCVDSNDHQPIIKKYHLQDNKLVDRNFVRLEILPLNSLTSIKKSDWEVKIDEVNTLPSWFEETKEKWFDLCLTRMTLSIVPDWIKNGIEGYLNLQDCTNLTSLGSLESVGEYLNLQDTQIKELPKKLTVREKIYR